ncbi:MAG: flagellar basal-body MS-ring/collar protein FliF [Armatimonadetes bacterium]|nr:flagellar basal-body MS-ring/collar protein FliF [Armatimonadota bacterium]MCX7969076.1 flagellar basal-body MS-ring/collar protein FliF [Armatimonadota bacterium]MDW8142936.1 flagellar basal-body MS-ring/collar protein FliF [Armatimonadota bacterium]
MERFATWWSNLTPERKRVAVVAFGIAAAVIVLSLFLLGRQESFVVLYSKLSPEDLAAASVELNRLGLNHQVIESEGAIKVPNDKVAQARMALAQAGLPRSGAFNISGFELLDKTSFATSDFVQRTNYLRALQGELARSIMTLDPIASARVHLNLPEPTVFEERREEPSASVVLGLKPGRTLSPEQTRAIAFLVSQAIEGLEPERVVIVDTKGMLLWSGDLPSNGFGRASEYLGMRWEIERAVEHRLQNLLDRTIGPGRASVQVSVELDTNKRESESEIYMPAGNSNQGVPVTHEETQETYQAQGAPAVGAAGSASNLQLVPPTPVTLLGGNYTKTERKMEYRVSRRVERIEQLPGSVKRVSVAVLVKGDLTATEQASLRQAVIAAVGLDMSRGDTVAVVPVRAEKETVPRTERREAKQTPKLTWYWLAAIPVLLLVAASLLVAWRRRRHKAPAAPSFPSEVAEVTAEEEKEPTTPPVPEITHSVERLREVAKASPDRLADLIRSWLLEDKMREEGRR